MNPEAYFIKAPGSDLYSICSRFNSKAKPFSKTKKAIVNELLVF